MTSKLSENEQVINTTFSGTKSGKEPSVSEEIVDVSQKFLTKSENKSFDTVADIPPVQLSTQISHEEVAEVGQISPMKQTPQLITSSTVPVDTVQTCSVEQQELIAPTEEVTSTTANVSNVEITVNTQKINQPDLTGEKHAKELSTASEILTVSPVPIQVAESVLQLEPKESMSGSEIMTQEVLSSTITPVHLKETENKIHINGSGSSNDLLQNKDALSLSNIATVKDIDTVTKLDKSPTKLEETLPVLSQAEQTQSTLTEMKTPENMGLSQTRADETLQLTTESVQQMKETESSTKETIKSIESPSECETTKTSSPPETPVRPARTKELNVPSTSVPQPTVQDSKGQEKVTKKVTKKSVEKAVSEKEPIEIAEGDTADKKAIKKVVKKVTKKPKPKSEEALDDGAESSSSKQKKTVKVVKKGTKTSQTPGTDVAVPETSSSSTSSTPIPPKRKTKPATKKSDVE